VLPTFVSVWIGNNDVLGAILDPVDAGNAADITPPATFATRYNALMDSIDSFGSVRGGALLGVVQAAGAPYVSQGRYYFAAQAAFPPGRLTVNTNCLDSLVVGPGDTVRVLVPFHYGAPIIAAAAAGSNQTLDCSVPQVISVTEALGMIGAVIQYNTTIKAAARCSSCWLRTPRRSAPSRRSRPTRMRRPHRSARPSAATASIRAARRRSLSPRACSRRSTRFTARLSRPFPEREPRLCRGVANTASAIWRVPFC